MMTTASVVVMFQLLVLILKRPWALQPRLFGLTDSTHIVGGGAGQKGLRRRRLQEREHRRQSHCNSNHFPSPESVAEFRA